MWRASVFTLMPDMFPGPLGLSLAGDALKRAVWQCEAWNIREHGLGRHRSVDDTPAGGGPGMVMRADVVAAALDARLSPHDPRPRFVTSPRGRPFTQALARELAAGPGLVLVCGRFEGIDERVVAARGLTEISIGDYVLSGGELAALVMLDSCVRLLPGVMGAAASGVEESFEQGLLEYPHYTRPRSFEGRDIPEVLLSGDHARIAAWRQATALRLTRERRPDLIGGVTGVTENDTRGVPRFAADFQVDTVEPMSISIRHAEEKHWWRFGVGETNGRRLLVHLEHRAHPGATRELSTYALDAFDAATREARERGMVD